jgi:LAS superfamily LD-carboxypeptidase LdcB
VTSTGYRKGEPFELELMLVQDGRKKLYLAARAAQDFLAMVAAAAEDGLTIHLNSAFREMVHQESLYETYTKAFAEWQAGGGTKPLPVARPGYSNHQSGTAVDIQRKGVTGLDEWLLANAKKFNFYRTVAVEMHHFDHIVKPQEVVV